VLGISPEDLAGGADRPETWTCGTPFLYIPVRDISVLGRLRFNLTEWEKHLKNFWAPHLYIFCRGEQESSLRARMFAPAMGITEDPATGAAATALAGYLAARLESKVGTVKWNLEQGIEMGRPSQIGVECDLDASGVKAVRIGGKAIPVFEGLFRLT
jgi:trans-2,3-dihydro-3-hydroxyanthranilate isomerase